MLDFYSSELPSIGANAVYNKEGTFIPFRSNVFLFIQQTIFQHIEEIFAHNTASLFSFMFVNGFFFSIWYKISSEKCVVIFYVPSLCEISKNDWKPNLARKLSSQFFAFKFHPNIDFKSMFNIWNTNLRNPLETPFSSWWCNQGDRYSFYYSKY